MHSHTQLFRTMDYGVIVDGMLFYCGRVERVIRIDEHLIELSSIEKFLNSLEFISTSAIVPKSHNEQELQIFVCLTRGFAFISESQVEEKLSKKLPVYVKFEIVFLEDFPTTINGEIDYNELLMKIKKQQKMVSVNVNVEDFDYEDQEMAKKILQIVGECIGLPGLNATITAHSNFFDIGGNSLNVIQTITELGESNFQIGTSEFLRTQDMADLVKRIKNSQNLEIKLSLDPKPNLEINSICDSDFEECASLLATCYAEKNNLTKFLSKLKIENIYHFLEANWSYFVQKELSFKVVDKSDKIVGVSLNYEREDESQLEKSEIQVMDAIFEYIGFVENNLM